MTNASTCEDIYRCPRCMCKLEDDFIETSHRWELCLDILLCIQDNCGYWRVKD